MADIQPPKNDAIPGFGDFGTMKGSIDDFSTIIEQSGILENNSAAKTAFDTFTKGKNASDGFDYLTTRDPSEIADSEGLQRAGKIYQEMGQALQQLGNWLPNSAGPLISQGGNLLDKFGQGLEWFGNNVIDLIKRNLWPGGDTTPDPNLPQSKPSMGDPLVLDLTGNGIDLVSVASSSAYFDFSGSGFAVHTGWIGSGQGLLVTTPTNGGSIISADNVLGAKSGNAFADLAILDSNGDGVIDSSDASFASLRVWIDNGAKIH